MFEYKEGESTSLGKFNEELAPTSFAKQLDMRGTPMLEMKLYQAYVNGVYWAQLCVIGADVYPETYGEVLFTNCVTLLGIGVFAIIIGSASSLVANMDQVASDIQREKDQIRHFLKTNSIPKGLQIRIINFFDYCGKHKTAERGNHELFDALPKPLRVELDLNLQRRLGQISHSIVS